MADCGRSKDKGSSSELSYLCEEFHANTKSLSDSPRQKLKAENKTISIKKHVRFVLKLELLRSFIVYRSSNHSSKVQGFISFESPLLSCKAGDDLSSVASDLDEDEEDPCLWCRRVWVLRLKSFGKIDSAGSVDVYPGRGVPQYAQRQNVASEACENARP